MAKNKILVIGGGASGIIAAIIAARQGSKVTIIERMDRIGKKILATGNGRCNLTNQNTNPSYFHSESDTLKVVENILYKFDINKTLEFFKDLGIVTVMKDEGKLYPRSEQASSVINVLLHELDRLKIEVICNQEVISVEVGQSFKIMTKDNKYYCNKLIIATGGKSSPDLGSNGSGYTISQKLGHTIINPFPSLVQLKTDFPFLKQIQGTKVMGLVKVLDDKKKLLREEYGEILFADYGISGPPVLQISRHASYRCLKGLTTYITIDLVNEYTQNELDLFLVERFNNMTSKTIQECLLGFINNRLIIPILKCSEIDINKKVVDLTKKERQLLIENLKNMTMKVTGTHQWNQSQVTAGGVSLREVDPNGLESKIIKNMYLCGEVLDVDGDCGGFNLQWAFSSGAVAGYHASIEES